MTLYDFAYRLGLGAAFPFWYGRPARRAKVAKAFAERNGEVPPRDPSHPGVLIHAVSLGEMNATRALVSMLRTARPDLHVTLSTTTEVGFARGQELYAREVGVKVVRYPLDFSKFVDRFLDATRPDVVVLMELELWPNFLRACRRREIPVVLANGRLTEGSYRGYRRARPLVRGMFRNLTLVGAQDETYADRFRSLGVPESHVLVLGSMKYDTADVADRAVGDEALGQLVGLVRGRDLIWVCGSTGPGEEEICLAEYRKLLRRHPRLRLVLVPRKPERFDEVARLIEQHKFRAQRRSKPIFFRNEAIPPVVLGDSLGELRRFYSLADVAFVGRSLVDLGARQHGSDMIEAAALAKPTIVGPFTTNFAQAVRKLSAAGALVVVNSGDELAAAVERLAHDPKAAAEMGQRAQNVVRVNQGATHWHARVILELMARLRPVTIE